VRFAITATKALGATTDPAQRGAFHEARTPFLWPRLSRASSWPPRPRPGSRGGSGKARRRDCWLGRRPIAHNAFDRTLRLTTENTLRATFSRHGGVAATFRAKGVMVGESFAEKPAKRRHATGSFKTVSISGAHCVSHVSWRPAISTNMKYALPSGR